MDRKQRTETIDFLRKNIRLYRGLMAAGQLNETDYANLEQDMDDLERLQRVQRSEYDFLYFMHEYFSEERNPGNPDNLIPADIHYDDAAEFHTVLCGLLDEITSGKIRTNVAWAVGRDHAKTAYLTNGYLCHRLTFRANRYIVVVSETTDVAGDFITWTNRQLKFNEKLRQDFGELMHERKVMNESDNRYEFVTKTNAKVEARGVGVQMRGLRHGSTRPDLFILDDLESKSNTNTPELRAKNKDWFREEMLPALDVNGMAIYMGTIVHYDSLLNYVIKDRRDFQNRLFPAVLEWSEREDLWDEWRKIYREDSTDAMERSDAFFEAHRDEMLRGTKVLWESRHSYLSLMKMREENGTKSFSQEYLNNPIDEESQIFREDEMTFYTLEDLPHDLKYYIGVDFASGKERGDYSSITVVGKSENGVYYVIESWNERVHPDELLKKTVDMTLHYQPEKIAVEAVQAQEWFADKVGQELSMRGYPATTRLHKVKHRTRKVLRIEAMLPDVQNGRIRFHKNQRLLVEMLTMFPNHNHDDAPDSLEMAIASSKTNNVRVTNGRKRTR